MSRAVLAAMSGLSPMQISNLERDRTRNPRPTTRERLARAFEVNVPLAVAIEAEREVAAQGPQSLVGFDPYDVDNLPTVVGVYVLYDLSDAPIYIGMSPKQPIRDHIRDKYEKFWFNRPTVGRASYIEIQDDNLCAQVGQTLIKFLGYHERSDLRNRRLWDRHGVSLDPTGRLVRHQGREAGLTIREYQLLDFLLSQPHRYFTTRRILSEAWADPALLPEEARNYIRRLRKILVELGIPADIVNARDRGYSLVFRPDSSSQLQR